MGNVPGQMKFRVKQFWQTATANTIADGTLELHATIDTTEYTITEASIRDKLHLADASGITMLPNNEIFEGMGANGIFGNMKRGFRGAPRPLLPAMLLVANPNVEQSPPPIPTPIPASTPTPIPETDPEPMEHTFKEPSPAHQHFSPPQEHVQRQMTLDDLLQVVPQIMTRVDSLEKDLKQTKLTMGSAIVKLVKKVKKLEGILKWRNMVLSDSEEEESKAYGRKNQDDHLVSLVQGLVTPSKTTVNTSGEEQPKSIDKGRRYKRKKETKGKKVVTRLNFQEEVSTAAKGVNTAEGVNTGSIKVSTISGQEEASLAEGYQTCILGERRKQQVQLEFSLAQRLAEEE
ncbi:hypothetical protein Tco_0421845 [Tanacetum coccineum]